MLANAADVKPVASQMVSLFIMDFSPTGTNIPHHHESEEEIYYVLRGHGDMVAGGGADGNEGRYPAREGDAFFLRLNTTVGFYSGSTGGDHDLILAVRSRFPFQRRSPTLCPCPAALAVRGRAPEARIPAGAAHGRSISGPGCSTAKRPGNRFAWARTAAVDRRQETIVCPTSVPRYEERRLDSRRCRLRVRATKNTSRSFPD